MREFRNKGKEIIVQPWSSFLVPPQEIYITIRYISELFYRNSVTLPPTHIPSPQLEGGDFRLYINPWPSDWLEPEY